MIHKCLFPVAGYGTRFLPATKSSPKEMLPVVNKPLIEYAVQEAVDAGFTRIGFVTGRGKRAIEDHFDKNYELEDQIRGLHLAEANVPGLDLSRVAIRGWSFGGYLAALAAIRRPDVFHCAVAGAPVTDWRWYDTHYTERYLGDPRVNIERYDADSLVTGPGRLERPLLLIHGLADDNVVAAHTLRLSSALLADGRPHEVLPLVGVSHMTPQEVVAENLLLHQLEFIRRSLPDPG